MTKAINAKPYFILAVRDEHGAWCVEFGDYDKDTVTGERDDYMGKYEETTDGKGRTLRASDLKVITVKPAGRRVMQADTDKAIAALNAKASPIAAPALSMTCKRCDTVNPFSYFAPVKVSETQSICTCFACANAAGFLTKDGDLKPGYSL